MDTVLVLELDKTDARSFMEMLSSGHGMGQMLQHWRSENEAAGDDDRTTLPGMDGPEQGPGSPSMPVKSRQIGPKAAAAIAVVSEKVVEEVGKFASGMINQSTVLNTYFQNMGKVFSAAIDVLLIPFTPILNALMLGATRLLAWMVSNDIPQKLYDGLVAVWNFLKDAWSWFTQVGDFFNGTFNPLHWKWGDLLSGLASVLQKFMAWIADKLTNDVLPALKKLLQWTGHKVNQGIISGLGWVAHQATGFIPQSGVEKALNWSEGNIAQPVLNWAKNSGGMPKPSDNRWGWQGSGKQSGGQQTTINLTQNIYTSDPKTAGQEAITTINGVAVGNPQNGMLGVGSSSLSLSR